MHLEFPNEWGIEATSHGYQFYPNRIKGEGFFMSILKNTNDISPVNNQKLKREWSYLTKNELSILRSWIQKPSSYRFYKKPNQEIVAVPIELERTFLTVASHLKRRSFGLNIGQIKKNNLIPSHELALSQLVNESLPAIELNFESAIDYLRKENFALDCSSKGWHLVRFQGHNLGWVKLLGNRFNNYLPNEWRIKNL